MKEGNTDSLKTADPSCILILFVLVRRPVLLSLRHFRSRSRAISSRCSGIRLSV